MVFASPDKEMLGVLTVCDIVLALHEEGLANPEMKISEAMMRGVSRAPQKTVWPILLRL